MSLVLSEAKLGQEYIITFSVNLLWSLEKNPDTDTDPKHTGMDPDLGKETDVKGSGSANSYLKV